MGPAHLGTYLAGHSTPLPSSAHSLTGLAVHGLALVPRLLSLYTISPNFVHHFT